MIQTKPSKASKAFRSILEIADSEKIVEAACHQEIRKWFPQCEITTPHQTDGYVEHKFDVDEKTYLLKLLLETKYHESFNNEIIRAELLIQAIYYLKKFEEAGGKIPNIVLVGDKNECFVVHVNFLDEYLDWNCNWSLPPSSASKENLEMVQHITHNHQLQEQCFVHTIDEDFDFGQVATKIKDLVIGHKRRIRLTEKNVAKVFEYFSMRILKRKNNGESYYESRKQVELFMSLVLNAENCYLHPKKKDTAVFAEKEVKVNGPTLRSLVEHYKFEYNAEEKKIFVSICDRLIEDAQRRYKGDFYTPTIWVDEAHKMLAENLGEDWKEKYMVWDCAWGTGNLTRDYVFKELYASTLYEHDLEIGSIYNREAVKFQYDFLNDDVEKFQDLLTLKENMGYELSEEDFYGTKLWDVAPDLIRGLLAGKKLLFFINPPYGTANNIKAIHSNDGMRTGIAKTMINQTMNKDKIGASSQQLFAQFIYRIVKLQKMFGNNIALSLYSNPSIITSQAFKGLRNHVKEVFEIRDVMLFQASEFADVSSAWGVMFSVWTNTDESTGVTVDINSKIKSVCDTGVLHSQNKILYNLDNRKPLSSWIRESIERKDGIDAPQMKGAIAYHQKTGRGKLHPDAMGYCVNIANNVYTNDSHVYILSSCSYQANGVHILPTNYHRIISNFTARRFITGQYANWINNKDEYMVPNTEHPKYQQWENDCIVYSLFNTASNQSSLRQIEYNEKHWDIYNHFFFMSKEDIKQLALDNNNDEVYDDIHYHGQEERFVRNKLQEVNLSEDAQQVLDKARELVSKSFKFREVFAQKHPEYHINTWDAGWYQIKGLLKEYMFEDLKEFNHLYKKFEARMRPLVVELGFLYDYPGYKEEAKLKAGHTKEDPELKELELTI